ncbi:hypothetical protein [Nostoc sp. NZL]|uniref:hypothetical protein n=1 Tax=Nostoc sp. NZL TaxID=2650612 RepID=UPI0018C7663F|nr:hypothetical protein [Nostoc sp. NZL]MBG1243766.1 hypothetical protein [Nostoc sp. NZL]
MIAQPFLAKKEHGKVINIDKGIIITKVEVSLDNGDSKSYPPGDLSFEELTQEEVRAEIKNVTNRVEKVASQLSQQMRTELPNHLRFIAEAEVSNDKERAARECNYVANNLEDASRDELVTKDWWKNTRISLEKIYWAMKGRPL